MYRPSLSPKCIGAFMVVASVLSISACGLDLDPYKTVSKDRANFPLISATRPLGADCGPNDSASIKRALMHPLGPTGGWHGKKAQIDYTKTKDLKENIFQLHDNMISGYVKVSEPGYLEARSYDDVYGDVYCGWSDDKLKIEPTDKYVLISFGLCTVGDGGLDQVHEIAFFPQNSNRGKLIFSSAHKHTDNIDAAEFYEPKLLGTSATFNNFLALEVIHSYLAKGDLKKAKEVIDDSYKALAALSDSVGRGRSGTTERIPARSSHLNDFALLECFEAGLSIGEEDFSSKMQVLEKTLKEESQFSFKRERECTEKMLPLFSWFGKQFNGKKPTVQISQINKTGMQKGFVGHEPVLISDFLNGLVAEEKFRMLSSQSASFWIGIKAYLHNDMKTAAKEFKIFLDEKPYQTMAFETAAAAKLNHTIDNSSEYKGSSTITLSSSKKERK